MITARALGKTFGSRTVLRSVDAEIGRGRITGLVGPNGAGKTTLLKLILGLARPDSGELLVDGVRIGNDPSYRAAIGYMPQIARFPAHLTGRELLETLVTLRGTTAEPELSLIDDFALGDAFDRPLGTLSGGTRQKINAVLAFAFEPATLLLDEPTAGLDPLASRILKDRVLAERARGRTVLVTSHVLPELEELADDVVFLADGEAKWQGSVGSLKQHTGQATLERAVASLLAVPMLRAVA
ncbi:MAG: ABC transporter ATP-binding protein [Gemmatimonadota bacterium]